MRVSALILFLTSLPALACPNLAGKYATCRSGNGESSGAQDLIVTQTLQNRITTYTLVSTDVQTHEKETIVYKADGKTSTQTETDPDTGVKMSLATTVSCMGSASVNAKMVLTFQGEVAATLVTNLSKKGNRLIQVTTGKSMGEEVNETVTCE